MKMSFPSSFFLIYDVAFAKPAQVVPHGPPLPQISNEGMLPHFLCIVFFILFLYFIHFKTYYFYNRFPIVDTRKVCMLYSSFTRTLFFC
jgi:hypothetical protein